MENDFRRIMECTCMRMRRATRRVTQLYDRALEPAGLTVNQFGLLAYLHGASLQRSNDLSISTIAEWLGMDPTTLEPCLGPCRFGVAHRRRSMQHSGRRRQRL